MNLVPARPVAEILERTSGGARRYWCPVQLWDKPQERADVTPFSLDDRPRDLDPALAAAWLALLSDIYFMFETWRSPFFGRSEVDFWWGGFDLTVSLYNGRRADPMPGSNYLLRHDLDAEHLSVGFWMGDEGHAPMFYAYVVPEPPGCPEYAFEAPSAAWAATMGEWVLPYEAVREQPDPGDVIRRFMDAAYRAARDLAGWDLASFTYVPPEHAPGPALGSRYLVTPDDASRATGRRSSRVEQASCSDHGSIGADLGRHGGRAFPGLGREGRPERGGKGCRCRSGAVVGRTDLRARPPGAPSAAGRRSGARHLRCPGKRGCRRGAGAAVMHDRGDAREQGLVVHVADDEAVIQVVDRSEVRPASAEDGAPALCAGSLDHHSAEVGRGPHRHAPEPDVHRRFPRVEERLELGRERAIVGQVHAPVWTMSRSVRSFHGARTGSAANQGWFVMTCSRTSATGARPIAARPLFSGSRYSALTRSASWRQRTRLSVSSCGDCLPGRAAGAKWRDGSPKMWNVART